MPEAFELDLDDPEDTKIIVDKDDGEGGNAPNKAVSVEDMVALQAELQAAKDAQKREYSARINAESRTAQVETESGAKLVSEIEKHIDSQVSTIEMALASAQGEIESARSLAAKAMEEGKWAEVAEANEALTDAKMRLRDLTSEKARLAGEKERAKTEAKAQPKAPTVGTKTQDWIASHPRFNSDPEYRAAALYGHEKAVKAGVVPESEEYFKLVEEITGDRKVEVKVDKTAVGEGGEGAPQTRDADRQSGVAPVTRRTPTTQGGGGPKKISLSGEQVEAADATFGDPTSPLMYIKDPKERYTYWHSMQEKLKAEGRL